MGFEASDFMYVMKSSGIPQPRRNSSGMFPFDRNTVLIPITEGASWRRVSSPTAPDKSLFPQIVRPAVAPVKSALLNSVPEKSVPLRLVLRRLVSQISEPEKS